MPVMPPKGLVALGVEKVSAAPVPLPKLPVLLIVGHDPAMVPTTEYGPEPITDVAVNVVLIEVPPDVVNPLSAYDIPGERPGETGTLVVTSIPKPPLAQVAVIPVC
jgi:hypothetical protein